MAQQDEYEETQRKSKTKSFFYHASGLSDVAYAKNVLKESIFNKERVNCLAQARKNFKADLNKDFRNVPYADFKISTLKEEQILANLKLTKQRWLVSLAVFLLIWLGALGVSIATLFVPNLLFAIYIKSWGFLLIVSVFLYLITFKIVLTEFVAWQITNQINSIAEKGGFGAFKQTQWLTHIMRFNQCGVKNENA